MPSLTPAERPIATMVGHLLQYHPIFSRLRDLVKQGALGEMQYMYSNRFSLGKIRAEEDVLWSFAPHDISMILSLTDRLVKSVRCEASDILQKNICDVARVRIEFEDELDWPYLLFLAASLQRAKTSISG